MKTFVLDFVLANATEEKREAIREPIEQEARKHAQNMQVNATNEEELTLPVLTVFSTLGLWTAPPKTRPQYTEEVIEATKAGFTPILVHLAITGYILGYRQAEIDALEALSNA